MTPLRYNYDISMTSLWRHKILFTRFHRENVYRMFIVESCTFAMICAMSVLVGNQNKEQATVHGKEQAVQAISTVHSTITDSK